MGAVNTHAEIRALQMLLGNALLQTQRLMAALADIEYEPVAQAQKTLKAIELAGGAIDAARAPLRKIAGKKAQKQPRKIEIISGEGTGEGTVENYDGEQTTGDLLERLSEERCGGDRWAFCRIDGERCMDEAIGDLLK
jgi:hypothetical protein